MQAHLLKSSESIKVICDLFIPLDQYQKYFKYKIYECFKPKNLKQTRNYMDYLISSDETSCNAVHEQDLSPELYSYLSAETETLLPNYINQKQLL